VAKLVEKTTLGWSAPALIYLVGFGPLLCAITFAAYVYEIQGREAKWDKTEKTGKVALPR